MFACNRALSRAIFHWSFLVSAVLVILLASSAGAAPSIKVACVGDSITEGFGLLNPAQDAYPARLGALLGQEWEVRNFGVSHSTLLENGNYPYVQRPAYQAALAYKPDVVVIALGTNDTKAPNFPCYPDDFEPHYRKLIASFRSVNPAVKVYACLPVPVFPENFGITDKVLVENVIPAIRGAASATDTPTIDLHSALEGKKRCFADLVHPNEEGALLIARAVYQELTGVAAPPVRKPAQGLTILPLGDSITVGATDPLANGGGSGYRDQLYALLKSRGVPFQFVGSAMTGASSTLRSAEQDFHEGHFKYQLSDLLNNLDANRTDPSNTSNSGFWFSGGQNTDRDALSPDCVLLLGGTNDIIAKAPLSTLQERMTALLDWFSTNRPNTRVFVGTLPPFNDAARRTIGNNDKVLAFNAWLRETIPARTSGSVTLVDHYPLFVDAAGNLKTQNSPDGIYLSDGVHPSHNGYMAMGETWFRALRSLSALSGPETPSLVVTSTDDVVNDSDDQTTLREAILYANTLGETSNPTITFALRVFADKKNITLNGTPLPEITTSLSIIGSKAGVTLGADGKSDILVSSAPQLTLKALTFAGALDAGVQNTAGTLSVEGCTFKNNARAVGTSANLVLRNSTLCGNGVAVWAQNSGTVTIGHCTIAGNEVGLRNEGGAGTFSVSNSIVTGNSKADTDAPLAASAFNLIGVEAGLDPTGLKDNGGSAETLALLPGSPAINAGDGSFDGTGQTDGRGQGFARVRGSGLDIGAFEVQSLAVIARDDSYSTLEDTPLSINAAQGPLANDFALDGQSSLRFQLLTLPRRGRLILGTAGAFAYYPAPNANGTDSFTYQVSDGKTSARATVNISVVPVNDLPVARVALAPQFPQTNTLLRAIAVGSDVEGSPVSFTYIWKKGDATIEGEAGNTLDLSKVGNGDKGERIGVVAIPSDGQDVGVGATASVTVGNTAPALAASSFVGTENQLLSGQLAGQDPDQDPLTYGLLRAPRFGRLALGNSGTFSYSPQSNWNGLDSFVAWVRDGSGASAFAVFTLKVAPVNAAPVAVNDAVRGIEDTPIPINAAMLLRNDSNGEMPGEADPLRIIEVTPPTDFPGKLELDVAQQRLVFTPKANWNGSTSFGYTIQDSGGATASAQVSLQLLPVNDAPVAQSGSLTVLSGTLGEVPLSGTDVDGDALFFALSRFPSGGVAGVVKVGDQWRVRYLSKAGFSGTDTLWIVAHDGRLASAPVPITITVKPSNALQLVGLLPNRGSFATGAPVVFEQKVRDTGGTAHLAATALLIGNTINAADAQNGATLCFNAQSNQFTLTKDDGTTISTPVTPGQTLENSQVRVTLGTSDILREDDGTLTLRWRITFKPAFTGTKSLWGRAKDIEGLTRGFTKQGDITVTAPPQPSSAKPSAPVS